MKNEDIKKSILTRAILDLVIGSVLIAFFLIDKMWIDFWSHPSAVLFVIITGLEIIMSIVYFVKWQKS